MKWTRTVGGGARALARVVAALAIAGSGVGAAAQVWDETANGGGDAGQLPPGQLTIGTGTLSQIRGNISNPDFDIDMYCITVPNPNAFTASVFETNPSLPISIWVFDVAGNGVAHAADSTVIYNPTVLTGLVTTPGTYFVAVARPGLFPTTGGSAPIFPTITQGMTGPLSLGLPVLGWGGVGNASPGPYTVQFEGAQYHGTGGGGNPGGDDGSQPDGGPWWTYETEDHFQFGNLFNLELFTDPTGRTCLRLKDDVRAWPFGAAAMSTRGTVIRFATDNIPSLGINEGDVLGEYRTAPVGLSANPSRTTVDGYGNVWVGNRDEAGMSGGVPKGSVTRIGLVLGGTRTDSLGNPNPTGQYLQGPFEYCSCEDRDGDGLIRTALGYPHTTGAPGADYVNTTLNWPNTASADTNGGVSTAEDECITAYYRTRATGVRHVSVDSANDVWVGGIGSFNNPTRAFELVSNATVSQLSTFTTTCGGYGGLVDPAGFVWSAHWGGCGGSPSNFMRYNPSLNLVQCLNIPAYGVGVDTDCTVAGLPFSIWTTCPFNNLSYRTTPNGVTTVNFSHGGPAGGIARGTVVKNGSVYVANSTSTSVGRLTTAGVAQGQAPMVLGSINGFGPHGVAADNNDKIWAINNRAGSTSVFANAMRIDPTIPPGTVDLAVDLGANGYPYNYSDFTGDQYLSINPQGTWTFVHDSGTAGTPWGTLSWVQQIIGNASITVRVRASDSPVPSGPWTIIGNNVPFTGVAGRYLQVQVTMSRELIDCQPAGDAIICELTICQEAECTVEIDEVVCDLANPGKIFVTGTLYNNSGVTATRILLTPMPPGSGVAFTPNVIPVTIPNGGSATFTTSITGWTDGEELCFRVTLLDDTLEACCTSEVCITPDCDCLQVRDITESIKCDPITGTYTYTFQIDNLTNEVVYHGFFFPPSGVTISPNYVAFPTGLSPNSTSGPITLTITGASAGTFCFDITLHNEGLDECCGREVCIDLPPCKAGGSDDSGTGAPFVKGDSPVHLDVALPTTCAAQTTAVLTIVNTTDTARSFDWAVQPGSGPHCSVSLAADAIGPASGSTALLQPGAWTDIEIDVDSSVLGDGDVACLRAVVVDPVDGFAAEIAGQVLGIATFTDSPEPATLAVCTPGVIGPVNVPTAGSREISFEISTITGQPGVYRYEIVPSSPKISLNGLPPGEPVRSSVNLSAGAVTTVGAVVSWAEPPGAFVGDVHLALRPDINYPLGAHVVAAVGVRDSTGGRCVIDLTGDGQVDSGDLAVFISAFVAGDPSVDITGDGEVDSGDLQLFIEQFVNGCAA